MIWPWVFFSLIGGGTLWGILWQQSRRLRHWYGATVTCGLSEVKLSSLWAYRLKLEAKDGPLAVRIEDPFRKDGGTRVVIAIPGPPGFAGVRIRRELSKPGAREIEIGDDVFDQTFSVEGPMRLVCALLDAEVRALLLSVDTESRLTIAGGELWAEMPDSRLADLLPVLLDLGRRFTRGAAATLRLAENARKDSYPGVRLRNLLLLARESPGEKETLEALRAACADASPQVRLRAAMELGAEGRDILVALAESTEDDASSAQAIRIVGADLPFERLRAVLAQALRRRRMQTAHACLEALGRSGTAQAVEALAQVIAREKSDLTVTAAQALGATASPAAEPPLIQALGRERMDLRAAAAKALGRAGSAAAVLPLKEAARRFAEDSDLVRAARQAIAEIQSRLPGASPGQLSLAGAEAGQLSLAQAEAGQLSLAGEQDGKLSLASGEPGQLSLSGGEEG